jgi:MFS family permease
VSRIPSERRIIAVTMISHFLVHVCELSFPAVAVLVARDLMGGAGAYKQVGFAYFIATLIFGAMALPAGFLSDHLGHRRVLLVFLFGSGLSMVLIGLAKNYAMLVAALGMMGGFIGLYHPAGVSLLSLGTRKHGSSMGIHGVGGNFGLAVSPFLASALAVSLGWRGAFSVLGILPLCFGLWVLFDRSIVIEEPKPEEGTQETGDDKKFILAPLLVLSIITILNGMCYRGFTTFLPAYFGARLKSGLIPGFSNLLQAGSFTTIVLVIGMFGQFLGGRLADRFNKESIYAGAFLLAAPFLFLLSRLQGMTLVLSAMTFAFFYFINQPVANAILPRYVSRPLRGRVYGWFFFLNFGAGSIMSWIAGVIAERLNLASIFVLLSAVLFLAGAFGILLVYSSRRVDQGDGLEKEKII